MKQQNRVITDTNICKMEEHLVNFFVHFLCTFCALSPSLRYLLQPFSQWKMIVADDNFIKEKYLSWKTFLTI